MINKIVTYGIGAIIGGATAAWGAYQTDKRNQELADKVAEETAQKIMDQLNLDNIPLGD